VGFANIGTAGTDLHALNIFVSSKPLYDQSLSLIEKCVVITTLAAHEIGHTHVTAPRKDLIGAHNASSGFHAVANLADDIILEPFMTERFPILADAFEFTGLWVLRNGKGPFPKVYRMKRDMTTADRFNVILNGSRYGDVPEVVFIGEAAAERDWSRDWARRLIASPLKDHDAFLALVDEAWVRIREEAPEDEQPEQPPIIDNPEGESGEGEGEPDDGDEDTDEGDDATDGEPNGGEGEPGDPNDAPRDWDDDDADADDGDGEADGSDGEGEDGDEPDGDTGSGDSKDGEPSDGETNDGDEQGDEPGESNDGESKPGESTDVEDGEQGTGDGDEGGGGGAASSVRDEDSFDKNEADESAHEQSQSRNTPRDEATEQAVRTYASTTVTSFGKHGTMTTVWD
jgi:hypothetical protein